MPTRSSPAAKPPTFPDDFGSQTVSALTAIREEWEHGKAGEFAESPASIGLMLIDIVTKLNLGPKEESVNSGTRAVSRIAEETV